MDYLRNLRKAKRKRILTLSAAGFGSGVQGVYLHARSSSWEILAHVFVPYPSRVSELIARFGHSDSPSFSTAELALLDRKLTETFSDCARTLIASAPRKRVIPMLIALNRLPLWKGSQQKSSWWHFSCGNASEVAAKIDLPVLTDMLAYYPDRTDPGDLPLRPGVLKFASRVEGELVVANVGQLSRLFVSHKDAMTMAVDTPAGPGTYLTNRIAQECECPDGFDRDGSFAREGTLDNECLEKLWETLGSESTSGESFPTRMEHILASPCLSKLSGADKMATLTALSAKSIFETYRKHYRLDHSPQAIWLSGGGANNLTLREFLSAYFSPIPVKTVDELGIPPDAFFPLALSLSVQSWIDEEQNYWEKAGTPRPKRLGTVVGF